MKTESEEVLVALGGQTIRCPVTRSRRKHVRIVVAPNLSVTVRAPLRARIEGIRQAVERRAGWIVSAREKMEKHHPLPSPKRYVSGETIVYLGRQYRLKVGSGGPSAARLSGAFLYVAPSGDGGAGVKALVEGWYAARAEDVFRRYMLRCLERAQRHGVPEPRVKIRRMKRRWGSCSSSGTVTLNLKLVQMPVHCIEYVMMHELCHLVHHDHSPRFYSLLTRCLPDWRARKEVLDRIRVES